MMRVTTVRRLSSKVVHGRVIATTGPRLLCGGYGDLRVPAHYDLTDGGEGRITCRRCSHVMYLIQEDRR